MSIKHFSPSVIFSNCDSTVYPCLHLREKIKQEFLTVDKKSPSSPGGDFASLCPCNNTALVKHRYFPWTCISLAKEHGYVFTSQTGTLPPTRVYEQSLLF